MTAAYAHRRGLTVWQRGAVITAVAALVIIFVAMWQMSATTAEQRPSPPTSTFGLPPRMMPAPRSIPSWPA